MGIKDRITRAEGSEVEDGFDAGDAPVAGDRYDVVVNKKDLNVNALTRTLNKRWNDGWRLAHMIEQHGNTVIVFERRD